MSVALISGGGGQPRPSSSSKRKQVSREGVLVERPPAPAGGCDEDWRRTTRLGRPAQQTMVGQTEVEDINIRRWQVRASTDNVERTSCIVCGALYVLSKAIARQNVQELRRVRIADLL